MFHFVRSLSKRFDLQLVEEIDGPEIGPLLITLSNGTKLEISDPDECELFLSELEADHPMKDQWPETIMNFMKPYFEKNQGIIDDPTAPS